MTSTSEMCPCNRCSGIGPTCEVGDHRYGTTGAACKDCGEVSGGLLAWFQFEKAEREGRACVDHFHRTQAAKDRCKTPRKYPDPEDEPVTPDHTRFGPSY